MEYLDYEAVLILDPEIDINMFKKNLHNFINKKVGLYIIDEIGLKNLVYEVRNNKKGYYIIIRFIAFPIDIFDIEEHFKLSNEIIKFIIVKKEDDI